LNASFGKRFLHATNRFFTPKIDDHGVHRGDTGQILAQWRRTVASSEALDVLYWEMHPVLYCRICMAIETASNQLTFFYVIIFLFAHNLP
jgi:hypothetical protein